VKKYIQYNRINDNFYYSKRYLCIGNVCYLPLSHSLSFQLTQILVSYLIYMHTYIHTFVCIRHISDILLGRLRTVEDVQIIKDFWWRHRCRKELSISQYSLPFLTVSSSIHPRKSRCFLTSLLQSLRDVTTTTSLIGWRSLRITAHSDWPLSEISHD